MQGKGGKASFDSFLKFYKAFTTKYEYKKKCFNYYVETIPRTMKKEEKMNLMQSKRQASHQNFVHTKLYSKEIVY